MTAHELPDEQVPGWLSHDSSPWFQKPADAALADLAAPARRFVADVTALPGPPTRFLRPGSPTGDLILVRRTVAVQLEEEIEIVVVFGSGGAAEYGQLNPDRRFDRALGPVRDALAAEAGER
ncbi:hypothetical protein [Mycolicibacter arupensis]|jgi:hypothetical protein|uniref:Uncharacterized protein n=1 Tax=Mycolicibacter arupensis TaxID=342002 RepID=A0A0F5MYN8_9MYCO|nr:hypothetical protein [Mycolicibacter arupensis]KKB99870.1 hypothetical protein WR43_07750 [Mycolicibacter arupensis]MCV7277179.1 hypothetical protein [Mycolicibacter arupensis]OQZ96885.1 hypothetical protein BST15_11480 [Mycolicibacter arupensis]